jgi:hypothetical protein
MQIDTDHVLFWMDAIRNSPDPARTLESFWKGQVNSKIWLIDKLRHFVTQPSSVDILGGWNGVLASLLFQSDLQLTSIRSVDIDDSCEETARTINKIEEMSGRFTAVTANMCTMASTADIVINTSCEHLTQSQYEQWKSGVSPTSLVVVQSNNYTIDEHVRIATSLHEFRQQSDLSNVLWSGSKQLPLYTRYMIIGRV